MELEEYGLITEEDMISIGNGAEKNFEKPTESRSAIAGAAGGVAGAAGGAAGAAGAK